MKLTFDAERARRFDEYRKREARETIQRSLLILGIGMMTVEHVGAEVTQKDAGLTIDSERLFEICPFVRTVPHVYETLKKWDYEKGFYLVGETGVGKTSFMKAFALSCAEKYVRSDPHQENVIKFINFGKLVNALSRDDWKNKNVILDQIAQTQFLFVDDLGTERNGAFTEEALFNLLDARLFRQTKGGQQKKTFFTSNVKQSDHPYDARVIRRIEDMAEEFLLK